MKIELLSVPGCAHVEAARNLLFSCLAEVDIEERADEKVGAFPSPTILIDGVDVMTDPGIAGAMCRLDVPTRDRLMEVLTARQAEYSAPLNRD